MRLRSSIEISSPPQIVFPWIARPSLARKWQKNVKDEEIILSTEEVVGTTFRETVEEGGRELAMEGVVTRFEANRVIAFHLWSKIHELDADYRLAPAATGTTVSVEAHVTWKFPVKVIGFFAAKRMRQQLTEQLSTELHELKRVCEGDHPNWSTSATADGSG